MDRRVTRRQTLATLGAGSFVLAGCIGDDSDDDDGAVDPNGDDDGTGDDGGPSGPVEGGTLHVTQDTERAEEFDPIISRGAYSTQVWNNIYDRLYDYDDGIGLEPKVATAMPEIERDETRFIFEIRDGIEFHNGDPLTASDVAHSFIAPVEEETDNLPNFEMVEATEALDEHTVQVDLAYPSGFFMSDTMAVPIVPEEARTADREAFIENPIGSGPYMWDDFEYNEYVEIVRNDDYWDEPKPLLDRIRYEAVSDGATRVAQMRAGDTDIMHGVPDADVPVLEDEPDVNVTMTESIGYHFLSFNCRDDAVTGNADVRRGVCHAFSIPDWVETAMPNIGIPHTDPFGSAINEEWDFPADEWEEMYPSYDPDLAQELIQENAPDDWNPTLITLPGPRANLAEEIVLRLGEIDVDAEVQVLDILPLIERVTEGDPDDYEMWMFGMAGSSDPDDYTYGLMHESRIGVTISPWYEGSEDFHDNMLAARQTVDRDVRRELYIEVVNEMLQEVPLLPAFDTLTAMASRNHVRDFNIHPNVFINPRLTSEYGNIWLEQ